MAGKLYFVTQDGAVGNADGILLVREDEMTLEELRTCVAKIHPKQQVLGALMDKGVRSEAIALKKATLFTTPEATAEAVAWLATKGVTIQKKSK